MKLTHSLTLLLSIVSFKEKFKLSCSFNSRLLLALPTLLIAEKNNDYLFPLIFNVPYEGRAVSMTSTYATGKKKARLSIWLRGIYGSLARDLSLSKDDRAYLFNRIDKEGLAFVTRILPLYSKYMLACIEARGNHTECALPTSFMRRKDGSPRFLGSLFKSAMSGDSIDIFRIRQLCEYGYKIAMPFTEAQLLKAEAKYEKCEDEMGQFEAKNYHSLYEWDEKLRKIFEHLYPKLSSASADQILGCCRPRFGPGSFLENGKTVSELYRYSTRFLAGKRKAPRSKLSRYLIENGYPLNRAFAKDSNLCKLMSKKAPVTVIGGVPRAAKPFLGYFRSRPSSNSQKPFLTDPIPACRLAFVPKDSRGPRTISVEPLSMSSISLGYNDYLRENIERESNGRVRFSDQSKHRELAREGSVKINYATVDLESASDRVRKLQIFRITRNAPGLRWGIRNSRTKLVIYPSSNDRAELRKFANMGNGLCFPFLSLSVQLSAVAGVKAAFPLLSIREISKKIWVYGDDLICPVEWYEAIVYGLEKSWLKVNSDKSYVHGLFRESCGGDYHNGNDVTPVRLRLNGLHLISEICQIKHKKVIGRLPGQPSRIRLFPKKSLSPNESVMPIPIGPGASAKSGSFHHCLTCSDDPTKLAVLLERHCRELGEAQLWNLQGYYYNIIEGFIGRKLLNVHRDSPYMGKVSTFDWNDEPIKGSEKVPKPVLGSFTFSGACEDRALSRALRSREPLESPFCDVPDIHIVNILFVNNLEATRLQYGLAN